MNKTRLLDQIQQLPKFFILFLINCYRYAISPLLGSHCRFYPSCSRYAYDAIAMHGIVKGSYLALRRLLRCHPWSTGGIDPVPECGHSKHRHSSLPDS